MLNLEVAAVAVHQGEEELTVSMALGVEAEVEDQGIQEESAVLFVDATVWLVSVM